MFPVSTDEGFAEFGIANGVATGTAGGFASAGLGFATAGWRCVGTVLDGFELGRGDGVTASGASLGAVSSITVKGTAAERTPVVNAAPGSSLAGVTGG